MGKIVYYHGPMGSGKSSLLLSMSSLVKNSYLCKPFFDERNEKEIVSRNGLREEANLIPTKENTLQLCSDLNIGVSEMYSDFIFFVDEAHFCTKEQVENLIFLADVCDASIYCFGLRTDSLGKLFDGTSMLFAVADEILEIPSCDNKEDKKFMHLDMYPEKSVNGIRVGDLDTYKVVSRREFFHDKIMKSDK